MAAAKFMFDEDFAPGGVKPTITLVEHERRSADAEAVAHRKGFEAGQNQARAEANERIARALTQIADSMARLNGALTGIETRLEIEAVHVAVAVAGKLAPELVAREPLTELSALAGESFRQLVATPQISVHIGGDIFDAAKDKLEGSPRRATAVSNGPTAASPATPPRPLPRSKTWSAAMSRPAPPR
jgi:flagellar assembly protein FliH